MSIPDVGQIQSHLRGFIWSFAAAARAIDRHDNGLLRTYRLAESIGRQMKGINVREWSFLDWLGALAFAAGALIPAVNAALKDVPELTEKMPVFFSWAYLPSALMLVGFCVLLYRSFQTPPHKSEKNFRNLLPPRVFPKMHFQPQAEFAVLPLHFTIDLLSQPPEVQVRFYVFTYVSRPVKFMDGDLALQVESLPFLEDITCRQKDLLLDPMDYEVVVFRRQLSDAERGYPWKAGRATNAQFRITAKATDGESAFTYGPVGSMIIEGWINAPIDRTGQPSPDIGTRNPQQLVEEPSEFVSLRDGTAQVYEALKKPPHLWTILADRYGYGDADKILDSMAGLVSGKIPLYGRQPPKTKIERLDVGEQTQVNFEGGAQTMRFLLFQMPPCTDLQVKRADVEALIESQRGRYVPTS